MQAFAFLSDIHGNLEALEAVSTRIHKDVPIYCLGDLVGYGANPNEAIEWAKGRNVICVMGNHDYAVVTGDTSFFNRDAERAILWTRPRLTKENMAFLSSLPKTVKVDLNGIKALLVHGSPTDPVFEYVFPETHEHLFDYYLSNNEVKVVALGHTHIPFVKKIDDGMVFNPGSIGQPRSGEPRACYALIRVEGSEIEVEYKLIEYDIEGAAGKILKAGLPPFLAQRLFQGI